MNPPGPASSDSHCPTYMIAFDASSSAIGFAYWSFNELVECGSVRSSKDTVQARIVDLMQKIIPCFQQPIPKEVVCVMEWSCGRPIKFLQQKGRSAQSSVPLAHAQGALFWWLIDQGLDVVPVGESEWTKRRGKYVSKPDRAREIHLLYPEFSHVWESDAKGDRHDAADAVGIGLYHLGQCKIRDLADSGGTLLEFKIPKGRKTR
jgi:hypothetical protein